MEKMDIFISWHGQRGHAVADALMDWLPQIVNAFNPWLSSSTDKGSRWRSEIAARLAKAKAGIICLTPSALTAPWLLFEAGAIAKSPDKTYVCTLLIDLKTTDVTDPLAQFQHTTATREEFLKLLKTLNAGLEAERMSEAHIEKAFEKWWPELERRLQSLPPDEATKSPHREERELLEELISLARMTRGDVAGLYERLTEQVDKSSILENQIDYLTNVLTPAASLSPTWVSVAALSSPDGSAAVPDTETTSGRSNLAKHFRHASRNANAFADRMKGVTPEDESDKK
jgi:hypothetical protein